jgi:hypothetical protein
VCDRHGTRRGIRQAHHLIGDTVGLAFERTVGVANSEFRLSRKG